MLRIILAQIKNCFGGISPLNFYEISKLKSIKLLLDQQKNQEFFKKYLKALLM
jgi:hypothetical protein